MFEVLSRYNFMSVLSIITVRFVCAGWISARHHDSLSIHAWQCSSRYGVHAPIAAGPANAEHVHNTAINEVTPIWAVLWYDTVRDRAFQFGQKKFRFDSILATESIFSIRFGNMINLPLVHWYSDSKLEVIFIVLCSVRPILRIGEYSLVALQHRRIRYIALRVSADAE